MQNSHAKPELSHTDTEPARSEPSPKLGNPNLRRAIPSTDVRLDLADGPAEQDGARRPAHHVDLGRLPRPRPRRIQQRLPGSQITSHLP